MLANAQDIWTLGLTLWGEARGEPALGQLGVAWVIRNRACVHPRWKGKSIHTICHEDRQFSCWNPKDPNLPKMQALTLNDAVFVTCLHIAVDVLGEQKDSPVGEATHYYSGSRVPAWARGKEPVVVIGRHRFFEDIA